MFGCMSGEPSGRCGRQRQLAVGVDAQAFLFDTAVHRASVGESAARAEVNGFMSTLENVVASAPLTGSRDPYPGEGKGQVRSGLIVGRHPEGTMFRSLESPPAPLPPPHSFFFSETRPSLLFVVHECPQARARGPSTNQ